MLRKVLFFCLAAIFIFTFAGCATAKKDPDLEMQGLRNQISVLEAQLASRDEEIAGLKDSLNQAKEIASKPQPQEKAIGEVKSRPNTKQIQTALANAGYYAGKVDGKMGRQTRSAIKEFQRANNLKPDGKVGKQTWAVLQEFLYKKVK